MDDRDRNEANISHQKKIFHSEDLAFSLKKNNTGVKPNNDIGLLDFDKKKNQGLQKTAISSAVDEIELSVDLEFRNLVSDFISFLAETRASFDDYDKDCFDRKARIAFLISHRSEIFEKIDQFLKNVWQKVQTLKKTEYFAYKIFYKNSIKEFFLRSEINRHFEVKPFGYPGDFRAINYIYKYSQDFRGFSSYEMLINDYTLSIPIAKSTAFRKDYFKQKILKLFQNSETPKILSVGNGAAAELLELLERKSISKAFNFTCLDFDKRALDYVEESLNKIPLDNKLPLAIRLALVTVRDLISDKNVVNNIGKQTMIYCAGVYEYLGKYISKRITEVLYGLLEKDGILIISNVNTLSTYHRAYYEMLGDWFFYHRDQEEIMEFTSLIKGKYDANFDVFSKDNCFDYLIIKKS
jgi:hypothetical protein